MNGNWFHCTDVSCALLVEVGGGPFCLNCFTIALGGYDLILSTDWLRTLGPVLWDFASLTISCVIRGRRVT